MRQRLKLLTNLLERKKISLTSTNPSRFQNGTIFHARDPNFYAPFCACRKSYNHDSYTKHHHEDYLDIADTESRVLRTSPPIYEPLVAVQSK